LHPNDEFHPPANDDPYWSETNWFAFGVPDRRLSGWLYPFFRPALGVCSAAVLLWDHQGDQTWNCRYFKQFWHLPMPDGPLSDFTLANGLGYRCLQDEMVYQLVYHDPDAADADDREISIALTFTGTMPPLATPNAGPAGGHLDQVGRFEGAIKLRGETIPVNGYGAHDRSWGSRSQFSQHLMSSGNFTASESPYFFGASENVAFQGIALNVTPEYPIIMGFFMRDSQVVRLKSGNREVLERDEATGAPLRVRVTAVDERGHELHTEGECVNRLMVFLNENLCGWNSLVRWNVDGVEVWGEHHDNFSAHGMRRFARGRMFGEQ
jgi:hypothetical protein